MMGTWEKKLQTSSFFFLFSDRFCFENRDDGTKRNDRRPRDLKSGAKLLSSPPSPLHPEKNARNSFDALCMFSCVCVCVRARGY